MEVRELRRAAGLPDIAANIAAYRTSNPVTVLPTSIRWISLVASKMVKILECMGRVIGIPARGFRWPCAWGTAALSGAPHGFPAAQVTARYAC
jgi:hypothetical protein